MQMIDVLKRLAELDAANPRVEGASLTQEQSLVTVTNVEGSEQINECGMMPPAGPRTPASIHMTADSGSELTGMLKDLMTLAGVKSEPLMSPLDRPALSAEPHKVDLDGGNEIGKALKVIDTMNAADEGPDVSGLDRDGDGDHDMDDHDMEKKKDEGQEDRFYTNSPEEEIQAHDYGDKQVPPKPQGFKQRQADNPYKPTQESVAERLMKEYQQFVSEQKTRIE